MFDFSVTNLVIFVVCLLISMTVHEFMHGYVADRLGDTTAREEGRLSPNPIKHIDPLLTLALPVITYLLFHAPILAAKPVPFTPWRVRYAEKGVALLAVAGPLSNLVLAVMASLALRTVVNPESMLAQGVFMFIMLNIALFVFNLIPIPPLDGSRVLYAFLPEAGQELLNKLEPYGFFIIIALVMLGGFGGLLGDINSFFLRHLLPGVH